MNVYKSPGVYTVEKDITTWEIPKKYKRKWKIAKVFDLEGNKIIITSTSKSGPTFFPQIW